MINYTKYKQGRMNPMEILSSINMLISSLGDYLVDEMAQSNESTREAFSNEIDKLETNIKQFHEESQKKSDEILSLLQKQELSKKEFESPLIKKNECKYCNRKKNGRFDTCCQACINGSHTADCHGRNENRYFENFELQRKTRINENRYRLKRIHEDFENFELQRKTRRNECKRNDEMNNEKNKSTDNLEIASKQPEIQQEEHREKNQITEETDSMKFRRILFTYHYGHNFKQLNPHFCGPVNKTFICIFCQKGMITREEFKVVRLGYNFCCNANPNAIRGILPVCIGCRGWDGKGCQRIVSYRFYQHIEHVEKRNLVSSDEIEFIRNHNNINTFPIVESLVESMSRF
jgi:hypothetical protein